MIDRQVPSSLVCPWARVLKGVLNPNFRPFSFELKKKIKLDFLK